MPFQIGNITVSSRPSSDSMSSGICAHCLEEAEETGYDDSFDDQFGQVTQWGVASECCEAEVLVGKIFLDKVSRHMARKDHIDDNDNVIVKKGQRYVCRIKKGYYIEDGEHKAIFEVTKRVV